ncbi:MAG: IS200/IS605 family transposase [Promethearchaeota archaeon]
MPDYTTYNHSVCNINYHFVWCTKFRKSVLVHDKDIITIFMDICHQYSWIINAIEVIPDHVHVFISAPPFDPPSKIAKLLKGISTRKIFKLSPFLCKELWEGHLWSLSYYCGPAGAVFSSTIKDHVASQCSTQFFPQFFSRRNSGVSLGISI